MSIDRIASGLLTPGTNTAQRFILPADDSVSHLTLGQVLKGRVLRHVEGSRYSVQYYGKEKIVDSSVPLSTGELLYGKVVGVGDQIELERIGAPRTEQSLVPEARTQINIDGFPASTAQLVVRVFTEYGAKLNDSNAAVLQRAFQPSAAPEPVIFAAVLLAKQGLPFTLERLEALSRILMADPSQPMFPERTAIYLTSHATDPAVAATVAERGLAYDDEFLQILSNINDIFSPQTEESSASRQDGDNPTHPDSQDSRDQRSLGFALFNLQAEGNLRHRVATIPLVIDGELVELNVGLVEQRESRPGQTGTVHRRLAFTLSTDALGMLAVDGTLTGSHLQLRFSVENPDALDLLDSHASLLRKALEEANFKVDAIRHEVLPWQDMSSPAWLTTYAVVRNDSLDRRL